MRSPQIQPNENLVKVIESLAALISQLRDLEEQGGPLSGSTDPATLTPEQFLKAKFSLLSQIDEISNISYSISHSLPEITHNLNTLFLEIKNNHTQKESYQRQSITESSARYLLESISTWYDEGGIEMVVDSFYTDLNNKIKAKNKNYDSVNIDSAIDSQLDIFRGLSDDSVWAEIVVLTAQLQSRTDKIGRGEIIKEIAKKALLNLQNAKEAQEDVGDYLGSFETNQTHPERVILDFVELLTVKELAIEKEIGMFKSQDAQRVQDCWDDIKEIAGKGPGGLGLAKVTQIYNKVKKQLQPGDYLTNKIAKTESAKQNAKEKLDQAKRAFDNFDPETNDYTALNFVLNGGDIPDYYHEPVKNMLQGLRDGYLSGVDIEMDYICYAIDSEKDLLAKDLRMQTDKFVEAEIVANEAMQRKLESEKRVAARKPGQSPAPVVAHMIGQRFPASRAAG